MAQQEKKEEKFSLITTHGFLMVNPLTEDRFTGEPSKPVLLDSWLKTQMDAGKIAKAE